LCKYSLIGVKFIGTIDFQLLLTTSKTGHIIVASDKSNFTEKEFFSMKICKLAKSALAVGLSFSMLIPFGLCASAATQDITGTKNYTITNPYATVDWNTWGHYKANLHTHSTVSDGDDAFTDVIEAYYAQGYDILGMTDHGVVNKGWDKVPNTVPLLSFHFLNPFVKAVPLTGERYKEITAGSDRGGRGMTDVPDGIELNAAVLTKSHVNGFFCDYGQGMWGKENDFEGPIAAVDKLGGLTFINHPGDWLGSAKDVNIAKDPKNIKFFADIIKKYKSCLGIEVLNCYDSPTRNDRVLWDGLLESVIPTGRNVWGFSNSDSHNMGDIDTSFEVFMMPSNNVANVRTAMENGTFFACGRFARPELGDGFKGTGAYPTVTSISVDNSRNQITIQGADYDKIQWISKGEVIATGNTIDLNAFEGQIGCYVRAQLEGPGGICMTQAFVTDDGSTPIPEPQENYFVKLWDNFVFAVISTRVYVIFDKLIEQLSK